MAGDTVGSLGQHGHGSQHGSSQQGTGKTSGHGRVPDGKAVTRSSLLRRSGAMGIGHGRQLFGRRGPRSAPTKTKSPGIRAKTPLKRVNSGSPKHFQPQPSLCHKRLHCMQRKLTGISLRGLTARKRLWFSRSHVASQHATANPHRSRRYRRRLAAFDSCARTYYPTNRCGTSQRVSSKYTGTLQNPHPPRCGFFHFRTWFQTQPP
ncbi:hypothetical protein D3C73_1050670 [compost metagenome]